MIVMRTGCLSVCWALLNLRAKWFLSKNHVLWWELESYRKKTNSTGCNYLDYAELYKAIRAGRPKEVLECGTGISTLVISHALLENEMDGYPGRVTSMEEMAQYYEQAISLLPERYRRYADILQSPVGEGCYSVFRGMQYLQVPKRDYDFVFVDGPGYRASSDGAMTFDLDVVNVIRRSKHPVSGLIDKRVSTCYVLQQLLGKKKFYYSAVKHIGYLRSSRCSDLGIISEDMPSRTFEGSYKVFGNSNLGMR